MDEADGYGSGPIKVLLIEDDELTRIALLDALTQEGMDVDALANAEDALVLIGAGQVPDVLVTDIDLGQGLHGVDLADMARVRHPDVEVIFISGKPADTSSRSLRAHETFLSKPFSPSQLAAAIRASV
jgi:DNA-binding response OmpR family regulator